MKTLIVAAGVLTPAFLKEYAQNEKPDYVIAADRGLDVLEKAEIKPDYVLGDFDSTAHPVGAIEKHMKRTDTPLAIYPSEKDYSDTEIAIDKAMEMKSDEIHILGATGGRLDHFLSNLQDLTIPLKKGVRAYIADEQNRIFLTDRSLTFRKKDCFGKYISFLPLYGRCEGVTLKGFKYELENGTLEADYSSLGISNEIMGESAELTLKDGVLIVVESKDKAV